MTFAWLIAIAAPLCTGWLVVKALWPTERGRRDLGQSNLGPSNLGQGVLRGGLSMAVGFAIAAIHYFAWRGLSPTPPGLAYKLADCIALPALAYLAARRFGRPGVVTLAPVPAIAFRWRSWQGALLVATLLIVSLALVTMAGRAWLEAYGYWDAWAIWNLKARFMLRGGEEWTAFFSRHAWYAHPDYPLLVPASVARLWTYLGDDAAIAPQLLSVGSATLMLALAFGVAATLRGVPAGCLAALVVAGAERVLFYGGSQMADIALSAYVTGGVGLIAIAGRADRGAGRMLVLGGLLSGVAGFVKNEGIMLALCLVVAVTIAGLVTRGLGMSTRRTALLVLLGMTPGLLTIAAQKVFFSADTYMLSDHEPGVSVRDKATDAARHQKIIGFIASTDLGVAVRRVGPFERTLPNKPMLWLLMLVPVAGGIAVARRDRFAALALGLLLMLAFSGYYAALLVMPYDLEGNLHFSFDRVQLHIYPTLAVMVLLVTRRLPASTARCTADDPGR